MFPVTGLRSNSIKDKRHKNTFELEINQEPTGKVLTDCTGKTINTH